MLLFPTVSWSLQVNMKMKEMVEKELKMKHHLLESPSPQKVTPHVLFCSLTVSSVVTLVRVFICFLFFELRLCFLIFLPRLLKCTIVLCIKSDRCVALIIASCLESDMMISSQS